MFLSRRLNVTHNPGKPLNQEKMHCSEYYILFKDRKQWVRGSVPHRGVMPGKSVSMALLRLRK
jgi:hypothetical protein